MATSLAGIAAAYDRWLDGPATYLAEAFARRRAGRAAVARPADDGSALRLVAAEKDGQTVLDIPLPGPLSQELSARLRPIAPTRSLSIAVPRSWVIERRMELPAEAAGHIDGIVATRLASLSPLPPRDVMSGHRAMPGEAGRIAVLVALVPRSRVAPILEAVSGLGWRSVTLEAALADGGTLTLHSGGNGAARSARRVKLAMNAVLGAVVALALAALIADPFVRRAQDDERFDLTQRADRAREVIAGASAPERAATAPEQTALDAKNAAVTVLGALDDLAQAMPDNSYASEVSFADGRFRLIGRTADVPGVLAALETSGRFRDSRLVGTALRDEDGTNSGFELETRPLIRTGGAVE